MTKIINFSSKQLYFLSKNDLIGFNMSTEANSNLQQFEFKAEMKQLLNLIVHSLYTHPEVFIRELISNASDALNKFRFVRLTEQSILNPEKELNISIILDSEKNTFTIEDSGLGMTLEELVNQLGTVASSGTLEFLENLKKQNSSIDGNMIGQFGVGFYSVYMVTNEITVETRSYKSDSKGYRWVSKGEDSYTIEEIEKETRGTKITFTLMDEHKSYANDLTVKSILKKYSNFVEYDIFLNEEKVNTIQALWHKKKEDINEEDLDEFYKFITNDFEKPLGYLQLNLEGNINFKALLFIPQTAPPMFLRDATDKSLHLYCNKIFISDSITDLLPEYLRFVRGVVDTEDLPLNVSREVIQSTPQTTKIRNVITSRVLQFLEDWLNNDKEKYDKFFNQFGSLLKTGVTSDYQNRDKIIDLYKFQSSKTTNDELTTFKEYVTRMKPEQNEIYYVAGDVRENIEKNPNFEYFKKNNIEVIYLTDPVDMFSFPYIYEYDKKQIKSIDKSDIKFEDETESDDKLAENDSATIIEKFKSVLGDRVEDVKISNRLVDSPASLVVGSQGLDPQMEKMMQMMDKDYKGGKRILEINASHPLIKNLAKINSTDSNNQILNDSIVQIFEGTSLIEGYLKSPIDFYNRMVGFMVKATKE